jgi:CRP-like cAMP-binding protein
LCNSGYSHTAEREGDFTLPDNRSFSTKNQILKALPAADLKRLLPDLEVFDLPHAEILYRPGQPIKYVFFPESAMISVIAYTEGGQSAEVGVIGFEGIIGIDALIGTASAANEHVTQLPDGALRISAAAAKKEFKRGGAFHDLVLRFIQRYIIQISQTALCNRLHSLEERLSRWILMCRDRSETDRLPLTQEFLAVMVGATRASVTRAAIEMQKHGYFSYSRGTITMIDRKGLETFTCDCYKTVKNASER